MQTCNRCNIEKDWSMFHKDKYRKSGYSYTCSECSRSTKKKEDPYKARVRHIRFKYGMSVEDYDKLYQDQEGKCAICGSNGQTVLYIDHCHSTNDVRGLLCQPCNSGLGMFKDNPELLNSAIAYLKKKGQ